MKWRSGFHSGNADNRRLGNAAYHADIIAYTAARFDQAKDDNTLAHDWLRASRARAGWPPIGGDGDLRSGHVGSRTLRAVVAWQSAFRL
jgi:hypothetical protein